MPNIISNRPFIVTFYFFRAQYIDKNRLMLYAKGDYIYFICRLFLSNWACFSIFFRQVILCLIRCFLFGTNFDDMPNIVCAYHLKTKDSKNNCL